MSIVMGLDQHRAQIIAEWLDTGARASLTRSVRARLFVNQMRRGRLLARSCPHVRVDGPYRPSGRNASPSGITHHPSCRRPRTCPGRGPR